MNQVAYKIAFSEVFFLINKMQEENKNKISKNFISFLENNKDNSYVVPNNISLNNPDSLKRETKIVLSIIYRNYFISEEEKEKKEKEDKKIINEIYSYDNIFKDKKDKLEILKKEAKEMNANIQQEDTNLIKTNRFILFVSSIKEKIDNFMNKIVKK